MSASVRTDAVCFWRQSAEGQTAEAEAREPGQEWRGGGCRPGFRDILTGDVVNFINVSSLLNVRYFECNHCSS